MIESEEAHDEEEMRLDFSSYGRDEGQTKVGCATETDGEERRAENTPK
jgi:hypothetical protein